MWGVRKKGIKCCAVTSKFWHLVALPEQQGLQFSRRIWHRSKMIIHSTCQRFQKKIQIHTTREARRIGSTGTFPSGNFDGWYYVKHKWVGRSVRIRMMFLPQRSWWMRTKKERCAHAASVSLCLLARKYFPHIIGNNHKNAKEINLYCCNLCQFYWVCQSFLTSCAWI